MFGQVWNTALGAFQAFNASNITDYDVVAIEQGATSFYAANFPTSIVAGIYSITAKERAGASAAVTDLTIGGGDYDWSAFALRPRQHDQLWRRFLKKVTLTTTEEKMYADDGSIVEVVQVVSDDSVTQTQGAGA